mmetsp:Transcript_20104/g.41012  ORF Transcript_20104/g.41012 Transcript_20104/m.41012 type:complete len:121 (+) Transcript_20104:130-492(+)
MVMAMAMALAMAWRRRSYLEVDSNGEARSACSTMGVSSPNLAPPSSPAGIPERVSELVLIHLGPLVRPLLLRLGSLLLLVRILVVDTHLTLGSAIRNFLSRLLITVDASIFRVLVLVLIH